MANIQPVIRAELDPTKPVPEICAVIQAMLPYHVNQEAEILRGVQEAIKQRLVKLDLVKGVEKDG